MTDLQISAITDVILACQLFWMSGLVFGRHVAAGSARFAFGCYLAVMGFGTMLGAIDHGFYEVPPHPAHPTLQFLTRATLVVAALALLWTLCRAYLSARAERIAMIAGGVVAAAAVAGLWRSDNFLIAAAPTAVVLLALLGLSLRAHLQGRGNPMLTLGVIATLATAFILVSGGDGILGLGLYGTLHVAAMGAGLILFLGGLGLPADRPERAR